MEEILLAGLILRDAGKLRATPPILLERLVIVPATRRRLQRRTRDDRLQRKDTVAAASARYPRYCFLLLTR